jgi:cobalt-zinc-cadmium efflux system protein
MAQGNSSSSPLNQRLKLGLLLNGIIILTEFIGGWWTNSLGLMSDAGHNLVDQGSLFLALYAHLLASRPATEYRTFGYHRAGTVAAFVNALILVLTGLGIGFVAIFRLFSPVEVPGVWIMIIAGISAIANIGVALLLRQGAQDDLNIRGAFLHMVMDAWMSVGVILAGLGIVLFQLTFLDPLISLVLVVVILKGSWPLLRESLDVILESTPPHLQTSRIVQALESIPGVKNVHDFHVWAVEPRIIMLTCHVLVDPTIAHDKEQLMKILRTTLHSTFGIHHMTIQLETECEEEHDLHCDLSQLTQHPTARSAFPHAHPH